MRDKTKLLLVKCLIVLMGAFLISTLALPPLLYFINVISIETSDKLMLVLFLSGVGTMILYFIAILVFKVSEPVVKADKYLLPFESEEKFQDVFASALENCGYLMITELSFEEDGKFAFYKKSDVDRLLTCLAMIRVSEWTKERMDIVEGFLSTSVDRLREGRIFKQPVNLTMVICVDRITPAFRNTLNRELEQDFNRRRLLIGISFGGKKIYIAKQEDGIALRQYRKMRKEFLSLMNLQEQDAQKADDR